MIKRRSLLAGACALAAPFAAEATGDADRPRFNRDAFAARLNAAIREEMAGGIMSEPPGVSPAVIHALARLDLPAGAMEAAIVIRLASEIDALPAVVRRRFVGIDPSGPLLDPVTSRYFVAFRILYNED